MNVNMLTLSGPGYPEPLLNISSPPRQLYWAGVPVNDWMDKPKVAIVGSRKLTPYGKAVTEKLSRELAASGVVIISGLAYGIDVTAHQAALAAGGVTVAVLGCGLNRIYPAAHLNVARQIIDWGTIISEYPAGSISFVSNFVARNRIISGLSDVVVIPEAALKSGSLHTARFGLEQGKTVMAVPGNINSPASEGCNNLIKSGAVPVTSVDDIFFALKISPRQRQAEKKFNGTKIEEIIFALIKEGVSDQDNLAAAADVDGPTLSSTLTMLEISGHIRPAGSGNWVIS